MLEEASTSRSTRERLKFQITIVFLLFQCPEFPQAISVQWEGGTVDKWALWEMHTRLYLSCQGQITDLE